MDSSAGHRDIARGRLPDSGISGSTPACGSPKLIAANHALHRLLAPRHPPCALSSLTTKLGGLPYRRNTYRHVSLRGRGQGSWQEPRPLPSALRAYGRDTRSRATTNDSVVTDPAKSRDRSRPWVALSPSVKRLRGAYGIRTHDLRLAKPALSQLS